MSEQVTHILRAMAVNYLRADVFDTLDSQALNKAADQIDALRAEAEALRADIATIRADRDAFGQNAVSLRKQVEALRAENGRLRQVVDTANSFQDALENRIDSLRADLETARGLLANLVAALLQYETDECNLVQRATAFLTANPAPEVQAEQGERQEAVATVKENPYCPEGTSDEISEYLPVGTKLYTTPQPGPDVRGLASFALELIDGAWKGGSFDGGDIQEAGVRHGLLAMEQRKESCGEHCDCAEHGFPAECYRLTPGLATHRQAQQGGSHDT